MFSIYNYSREGCDVNRWSGCLPQGVWNAAEFELFIVEVCANHDAACRRNFDQRWHNKKCFITGIEINKMVEKNVISSSTKVIEVLHDINKFLYFYRIISTY